MIVNSGLNDAKPTNADVKQLFEGEFGALLQMPKSSLSTYIMEAEKELNNENT